MSLLLLLLSVALAQAPAAPSGATPQGPQLLSEGDAARYRGDRQQAVQLYRQAAAAGDPAAEAMARLRLLGLGGNFAMAVQGGRIDQALLTAEGPWGLLAWADFHLFAPAQLGADKEQARQLAMAALATLPGPSMARLYLATGDPYWLEALADAPDRDGLGDGLLATGGALQEPGTWFLGLGLAASPGAGFGGGAVFVHPDLGWKEWALTARLAGSTLGTWGGSLQLRSPGDWFGWGSLGGGQTVGFHWMHGPRERYEQSTVQLSLGPGARWGDFSAQLGGRLRWDGVGAGLLSGHGPVARVAWDTRSGWGATRQGWYAAVVGDLALGQTEHLGAFVDLRGFRGQLKGVGAARLTWQQEFMEQAPFYRLPVVGGAELHRGAWAGRYRADQIATLDLEQRWMIWGPLEAAVFANAAWVAEDGLHPGGGVGIRLVLPPEGFNVVRLDVAVSDSSVGERVPVVITTGWGEAF